jgi:hypothetical protein
MEKEQKIRRHEQRSLRIYTGMKRLPEKIRMI